MLRARLRVALGILLLSVTAQSSAVEKGQSLSTALQELRAAGLQVVFSSSLVDPSLVVMADPGTGHPEDLAQRILAPHGLVLQQTAPGYFVVTRAAPVVVATPAPPAASGDITEIKVFASRYELSRQPLEAPVELRRRDLEGLPGLNQDAMRVTHYVPGTASNALSARTHVRGGRDDETAVWFDGAPLFEPFHFKDVQGIVGVLDPGAIQSVEFYSGVFPVRYGNRLSGVLDFKPRTGNEDHTEIGASLLYTHGLTQGRMDSQPIEWLAAVRHSSVDVVADTLGQTDIEPNFLDALGRFEWRPGADSALAVGWLLLDDGLDAEVSDGEEIGDMNYRDGTAWLNWKYQPSASVELSSVLSYTNRRTDREGTLQRSGSAEGFVADRRRFKTRTARIEGSWRADQSLRLLGGFEWYGYQAAYAYSAQASYEPLIASAIGRPTSIERDIALRLHGDAYAAYSVAQYEFDEAWSVDLGIRWDIQKYEDSLDESQLSPRLGVQYRLTPDSTVRLSWGRTAQAERPDELQVPDGELEIQSAQRATQTVLSFERAWSRAVSLRVEGFDKRVSVPRAIYENLFDPFALLPEIELDRVRIAPNSSRIYGAEASVRWASQDGWSAWGSYSWSETTDTFGSTKVPRSWQQRHSVGAGVNWRQGPWELAANTTWRSGWRRNVLQQQGGAITAEARNISSWPSYLSIDLRGVWRRPLRWGVFEVAAEVNNLSNHANYCCRSYRFENDVLTGESSVWLPRFYMLEAKWSFPH